MRKKVTKIKRKLQPDLKYGKVLISKFINMTMKAGKKIKAHNIVYKALELAGENLKKDPLEIFDTAIKNVSPLLEIKARRIGGATYQVPQEVKGDRAITLAFRWIIDAARKRKGKSMAEKLSEELINAYNNTGVAVKKRQDMHRMAEANRAFAHFG